MKKVSITSAAAVVLAGVLCFGSIAIKQEVMAGENICSYDKEVSSTISKGKGGVSNIEKGALSAGNSRESADKAAQLHNPIVDASTGAAEFSYIYFGSYPQREVREEELTDAIINAQYVSGEAVVLGSKYLRLEEKGVFHYYKYEPVCWRVMQIEDGKAVLRSDAVLDYQTYHVASEGDVYKAAENDPVIRRWLNSKQTKDAGFLEKALTQQEKDAVLSKQSWSISSEDKSDKIYMLSYLEYFKYLGKLIDEKYVITKYAMASESTEYVKAQERMQGAVKEECGQWWLRGCARVFVGYVEWDGFICARLPAMNAGHSDEYVDGHPRMDYCTYAKKKKGVCPALTLDLSNTKLWYTKEEQEQLGNETEKEVLYKLETMYNQKSYPDVYGGFETQEADSEMDITIKMTDISEERQAELLQKAGIEKQTGKTYRVNFVECQYSLKDKEQILPGDVDNNKKINLSDAKKVLRWALRLEQPGELYEKSDVDGDSAVTLKDAKKILRMALNLV